MQARAPNSPVIIVGTHIDKLSTRQLKDECRNCQDYIGNGGGTKEGGSWGGKEGEGELGREGRSMGEHEAVSEEESK